MKKPTQLSSEEVNETRKKTDDAEFNRMAAEEAAKGGVGYEDPGKKDKTWWWIGFWIFVFIFAIIMGIGTSMHRDLNKQKQLKTQPTPTPLYPPSGVFEKKPADQLLEQLHDLMIMEEAIRKYENKWPQPTPHPWIAPTPKPMLDQLDNSRT